MVFLQRCEGIEMIAKSKKSQALIIRFIFVFMGLIMLYFAYQMISPLVPEFLSGKELELQILIFLIIPFIFFFFIIYMFKSFKQGENE